MLEIREREREREENEENKKVFTGTKAENIIKQKRKSDIYCRCENDEEYLSFKVWPYILKVACTPIFNYTVKFPLIVMEDFF